MNRTEIINALIKKFNYKFYLEIGVLDGDNLGKIECDVLLGVEPHPSASLHKLMEHRLDINCYFGLSLQYFKNNDHRKHDIIFIDGDHTHRGSLADFIAAREHLNYGGCIVLHDCLPKNASEALPVKKGAGPWCGEVYKTIAQITNNYYVSVIDCDNGVGIIFPDKIKGSRCGTFQAPTPSDFHQWYNPTNHWNKAYVKVQPEDFEEFLNTRIASYHL